MKLPIEIPEFNREIKAIVKSDFWGAWDVSMEYLIAVDESDCTWRFTDDGTELGNFWDVVYWEYVDELSTGED